MAISVSICNVALGELKAAFIADIDEVSLESKMCQVYYPVALNLLIDFYSWSFLRATATLAQLANNDLAAEWAYAYAMPTDCAKPIRLIPTSDMSTMYDVWDVFGPGLNYMLRRWSDYSIQDTTLYCNNDTVVLEYTTSNATEDRFSASFGYALSVGLAALMAIPLRNDRDMKAKLMQEAEIARDRAQAEDINRQPRNDLGVLDDVGMARMYGWR